MATEPVSRRAELSVFFLIVAVLLPAATVLFIALYGFGVWLLQ